MLIDDTLPFINWLTENEILPREKYEWKAYGKIAESEYYYHKTVNQLPHSPFCGSKYWSAYAKH